MTDEQERQASRDARQPGSARASPARASRLRVRIARALTHRRRDVLAVGAARAEERRAQRGIQRVASRRRDARQLANERAKGPTRGVPLRDSAREHAHPSRQECAVALPAARPHKHLASKKPARAPLASQGRGGEPCARVECLPLRWRPDGCGLRGDTTRGMLPIGSTKPGAATGLGD